MARVKKEAPYDKELVEQVIDDVEKHLSKFNDAARDMSRIVLLLEDAFSRVERNLKRSGLEDINYLADTKEEKKREEKFVSFQTDSGSIIYLRPEKDLPPERIENDCVMVPVYERKACYIVWNPSDTEEVSKFVWRINEKDVLVFPDKEERVVSDYTTSWTRDELSLRGQILIYRDYLREFLDFIRSDLTGKHVKASRLFYSNE